MTAPANPALHIPAHKQTDPAKRPGQIRFPGMLPALAQPYGEFPAHNVWVQAVKQYKEQAK